MLCSVASISAEGHPQARTLVLRNVDGRLALFYNARSPKHKELDQGTAIVCYFASLKCQWRLQCDTEAMDREIVHASWKLRPDMPKRLDWYYTNTNAQSAVVDSREALYQDLISGDVPSVAPNTSVGLWLCATQFERLDLGQADGLHERLRWRMHAGSWRQETLVP